METTKFQNEIIGNYVTNIRQNEEKKVTEFCLPRLTNLQKSSVESNGHDNLLLTHKTNQKHFQNDIIDEYIHQIRKKVEKLDEQARKKYEQSHKYYRKSTSNINHKLAGNMSKYINKNSKTVENSPRYPTKLPTLNLKLNLFDNLQNEFPLSTYLKNSFYGNSKESDQEISINEKSIIPIILKQNDHLCAILLPSLHPFSYLLAIDILRNVFNDANKAMIDSMVKMANLCKIKKYVKNILFFHEVNINTDQSLVYNKQPRLTDNCFDAKKHLVQYSLISEMQEDLEFKRSIQINEHKLFLKEAIIEGKQYRISKKDINQPFIDDLQCFSNRHDYKSNNYTRKYLCQPTMFELDRGLSIKKRKAWKNTWIDDYFSNLSLSKIGQNIFSNYSKFKNILLQSKSSIQVINLSNSSKKIYQFDLYSSKNPMFSITDFFHQYFTGEDTTDEQNIVLKSPKLNIERYIETSKGNLIREEKIPRIKKKYPLSNKMNTDLNMKMFDMHDKSSMNVVHIPMVNCDDDNSVSKP